MVAQFSPQTPNIDPWLIPKLDIFLDIKDVTTSEAAPLEPGQMVSGSISRSSRIVEMDITASGIQIALIKNAVSRLFTYIKDAVTNDINIATVAALPLTPYAQPTDKPQIKIVVDVNRTKPEKTVQLQLKVLNLKKESLQATFERLLTYIDAVVTNDMNPLI